MRSKEYRGVISLIIRNIAKKRLPGIKPQHIQEIATEAAKVIHARMYGANVEGVDSPIWRDCHGEHNQPTVDASQLLQD